MKSDQAGIQLFLSNRLENLADALIKQIAETPGNPLEPDTLLIQNRGMSRWLNLRIADETGIQMNTRYLYPRALVETLLDSVNSGSKPEQLSAFAPNTLFWRIFSSLPNWSRNPKARVLKHYLESSAENTAFLKRYQLSNQLAQHIDQLQQFRPDLLRTWAKQIEPENWRSFVWQQLSKGTREIAPSTLFQRFTKDIQQLTTRPANWPESLHIFGISSLPPVYLDLLKHASKWMPVYVYLTQPSPLYWGDQISKKKRLKAKNPISEETGGHNLLGNLGKQGQDFLNTLIDAEVFARDESEFFHSPSSRNLLTCLQNDLFNISEPSSPKPHMEADGIQVRVCHSLKREIEVLKNELLAKFENDPKLTPDQIVIMAPDIEVYASSIRSVFGGDTHSNTTIPFSIADYSTRSSSSIAHAFLSLLSLLESRFSASEVMNFISIPAVSESFGFQQEDWNTLRSWIEDTNIRWGIDAEHRLNTSGISFDQYSWQQGIDRLISGYLIHPEEASTWEPHCPHPDMEGNSMDLLNRFLELWQFLKLRQGLFAKPMKASSWVESMREMVHFLFGRLDSQFEEYQSFIRLLSELSQEMEAAKADDLMTLTVIRTILEERLAKDFQAGSFFSGTVTFCSMMPMRNVPARFIGLIGMNEGAFPRRDQKSEFTQFPDGYRLGDRSKRDDDRYLFLECILAARTDLYFSYTGIESQTLKEQPASIIVEELLDTLENYYQFPNQQSSREALIIKEPLQAFSPHNFQHHQPRSYSIENLKAARSLIGEKVTKTTLEAHSVTIDDEVPISISLDTFLWFFSNPCRYWLSERLDIRLPYQTRSLEDTEPIEPNGLLNFQWGNLLLENPELLSRQNEYKLRGTFPVGAIGRSTFERLLPDARSIINDWKSIDADHLKTLQIDLQLEEFKLTGQIQSVSETHYKHMRFGKIRSIDILTSWLQHLVISQGTVSAKFQTHIMGKGQHSFFNKPSHALEELLTLGKLFTRGQAVALPFFVDTAYQFAKASLFPSPRSKKSPQEIAFNEFTKHLEYPFQIRGEAYDTYNQLCFPDPEVVYSKDFEALSLTIFGRALEHMEGGPG